MDTGISQEEWERFILWLGTDLEQTEQYQISRYAEAEPHVLEPAELIEQLRDFDPDPPAWDILARAHHYICLERVDWGATPAV